MRSLATRPPRIGLPLFLSAMLSTAVVTLHITSQPLSAGPFISTFVAGNSAYYFARYLQGRAAINRSILTGGNAWPVAQLFPGKAERVNYPSLAVLALILSVVAVKDMLPEKDISTLRWSEDRASIALTIAYFLGLAVSIVVYIQARHVREAEDNILCGEAHEMHCPTCSVHQASLDTPQDPLPTNSHLRTIYALKTSWVLSVVLSGVVYTLAPGERAMTVFLIILSTLAGMHRTFFIHRATRNPARLADWPASRLFPGNAARAFFHLGNMVVLEMSIAATILALSPERWTGWSHGTFSRAMMVIKLLTELVATVVNGAVLVRGYKMERVEARAVCVRDGHRWKCLRYCTLLQDQEASVLSTTAVSEKAILEVLKQTGSSASSK